MAAEANTSLGERSVTAKGMVRVFWGLGSRVGLRRPSRVFFSLSPQGRVAAGEEQVGPKILSSLERRETRSAGGNCSVPSCRPPAAARAHSRDFSARTPHPSEGRTGGEGLCITCDN